MTRSRRVITRWTRSWLVALWISSIGQTAHVLAQPPQGEISRKTERLDFQGSGAGTVLDVAITAGYINLTTADYESCKNMWPGKARWDALLSVRNDSTTRRWFEAAWNSGGDTIVTWAPRRGDTGPMIAKVGLDPGETYTFRGHTLNCLADLPGISLGVLVIAYGATCSAGQKACGRGCIALDAVCCDDAGRWCPVRNRCVANGCAPWGEVDQSGKDLKIETVDAEDPDWRSAGGSMSGVVTIEYKRYLRHRKLAGPRDYYYTADLRLTSASQYPVAVQIDLIDVTCGSGRADNLPQKTEIRLAPGQSTIIHNELSKPCAEYVPIQNVSVRGRFTVDKPRETKPADPPPPTPTSGEGAAPLQHPAPSHHPASSHHPAPAKKTMRRSGAAIRRDQQRERQRQQIAALQDKQQREREQLQQTMTGLGKTMNDLAAAPVPEGIRHAEISVQVPMGLRGKEVGGSAAELGASFGTRLELRIFSWSKASKHAPTGNGFELAIAGGVAGGRDTGATVNGFSRLRLWRGPFAIGVFADVDINYRGAGSEAVPQRSVLAAVGPEIALGLASKRKLAAEIGGRLGTVGTWPPSFSFDATGKDLYFSTYMMVGVNMMYAGAVATRYHNLSQDVQASWIVAGVLGLRIPF